MGFFKKLFGDATDELKKNLEDAKNEMLSNLEEVKQDVMGGFTDRTSNSRDDDEEDDEEPKILLGDFRDGVLTIREGITELDDESLEYYKRIRKIIFPASLESLDSGVIDEQEQLEELDFSKVTKLETIPDEFIYGETKIRKFIIPNGVTEVGDGFLGDAKSGAEIFVPDSVRKLGYITSNSDNDIAVYLFAANIDISDVERDVKTLYVLPQYYGWYAKALKKCDSEARLREMPEEMMGVYGATSLGELKEIAKDNASLAEDSNTESVDDNITDIVQKIKEKLQALDLSSFILYGNDYEGDREYEEVEQLGDEGLLESSSEYAINYNDSYDGNSSVYTKVRKIEVQESGVTFDIEEIYEDNDGDEESRGFHEAQTIDRILESCNRDTVKRGLENILTYLNDETLIKLNKNTENESMLEPVLEPKPEPEAETKVEVEQKEEPIENGGLFSARLEAMIAAALQDGVLTDKERELLKRRVEKEGEDWDEVEMIIEARLAEMNPVAFAPSSRTSENNNVSKDTTPQDNKNTTPQDVSSKADNEYPEDYLKKMKITAILPFIKRKLPFIEPDKLSSRSKIDAYDYLAKLSEYVPDIELSVASFISCAEFYETMGFFDNPEAKIRAFLQISEEQLKKPETIQEYKKKKIDALRNAQSHKNDSEQAKQIWRKAVSEIKMIDTIIRDGVKSVDELKLKLQKEQMKLQMEEQAEMKPTATVTQVSQAQVQSEVVTPVQESPYLVVNGKEYKDVSIDEIDEDILTNVTGLNASDIISVTIPSSVKKIDKEAFSGCTNLVELDFSQCLELKEIGESVFLNCGLKSIDLSRCTSLETIGETAFCGCKRLTNIIFPNSLCVLGGMAFGGNEKLSQIDLSSTKIKVLNDLFGTTGQYFLYWGTSDDMKNLKKISFPASIQEIPEKMCYGLKALESVDLSKCTQLKRICESAFACTPNLKEVLLSDSIEVMEKWALAESGNIKHINMPPLLKEMGYGVFAGSKIEAIDFSRVNLLKSIPEATFGQCGKLKSIILPSSLEEVGEYFFEGVNTVLKNIDFSKVSSLEVIPSHFLMCDSIKSITIPVGVKTIEDDAFGDMDKLEKMFLPPTLEHFGSFGYYDIDLYCFAPQLDEFEPLVDGLEPGDLLRLYVLPQYLRTYIEQRDAEGVSDKILSLQAMPDEYLYFYDN